MTFRVGFWTTAMSYAAVLLVDQGSLSSASEIAFEASMGAILGLVLASMFAQRANRRRIGRTERSA
jgi:hypothetical protein